MEQQQDFDYAVCRPGTPDRRCPHQGTCWLCQAPVVWTDWLQQAVADDVPRICVHCALMLIEQRDRQN